MPRDAEGAKMGDTFDIHNLLQTGYFTTSRAKGGVSPAIPPVSPTSPRPDPIPDLVYEREIPRTFQEQSRPSKPAKASEPSKPSKPAISHPRTSYLPPPIVEDEAESLAKEHGSPNLSDHPDEAPQSRGDFQQESIMEEVHEHNPERRFVVVAGEPKPDTGSSEDEARIARKRGNKPRQPTVSGPKPDRVYESVFDDKSDIEASVPVLVRRRSSRRKSRNELPRIDTDLHPETPRRRQRTKSAVGGSRPDYFDTGSSRQYAEGMLSPEVVKHGPSRRDRAYHGYGLSASPNGRPGYPRSLSNSADDRMYEEREYNRGGTSPTMSKRSSTYNGGSKHSRHISSERGNEPRPREEVSSSRSHRREGSKSYGRSEEEAYRGASTGRSREPKTKREDSRSSDEHSRSVRTAPRRRRDSVVIQDERRSMPHLENGVSTSSGARPPSRGSNLPLPSPRISAPSELPSVDAPARNPVASTAAAGIAGAAIAGGASALNNRKGNLPYPEDDYITHPPERSIPVDRHFRTHSDAGSVFSTSEKAPALPADIEGRVDPLTTITAASPATTNESMSQPWEPGTFNPERDGLPVEKPVGSYRRYSENIGTSGPPKLPECRFIKPVAGVQGWLTLPRSDFNICTGCYTAVFADTEYRTHFQPMLYGSDRPIACDFGSSPWYRIAWLLTLRGQTSDLRLFNAISRVATVCRKEPCPGDRRATRAWLTIIDPYTRRPIPKFAVCQHCAKTVEALLPNLANVFVPLNPRSEPSRNLCALHFTPQRKQFVMYFDALETTADVAHSTNQPPNLDSLSQELEKLSLAQDCPHDDPVADGYWHVMQYLPTFTVCSKCFGEVVKPRLDEENLIARNFFMKPQRIANATCQLYSDRMRDVFRRACRRDDADYLASKVRERAKKEDEIHSKLLKLDRKGHDGAWTAEQVKLLVEEWKQWE